ncbi:MAG: phosphomannomutase/phosphoglucomutase [bacterium]|nr:phosphomannomutase/phosphoglucomutase [bacterium]
MHKIAEKKWSEKIFKAYDIRGLYPAEINEDACYKIARAFARYLRLGSAGGRLLKIIVSSDARSSSPTLKEAFVDGLTDEGVEIIDAGLTTTPMHYFAVNILKADGGAMITASHLPMEFNGLKLSKKGAMPIGEGGGMEEIRGDAMRGIFASAARTEEAEKNSTPSIIKKDFLSEYIEFLTSNFPNLKSEITKLISGKKIPGISFDTDEDRVMFKDEKGNAVPGDIITALLAQKYAKQGEKTIYDVRSSRAVKETIEANGAQAVESRVGHAFIKPLMRKENAIFGGELSGHYYFRDFFFCDSGIFGALAVLDLMRGETKTLSELIKPLLRYAKSEEINFKVQNKDKALDKIAAHFADGKASYLDGLKVEYPHWWFNLRISNTENLVRLNIEAVLPELLDEKKKLIEELLETQL